MQIDYWQTFYENAYYHVYNRAIGTDLLFLGHDNYQFFLQKWQKYLSNYLDTYAYCLMSNHFHFIVKVKPIDDELKICVQEEGTVAARAFLVQEITFDAFLEDQFKRFFTSYAKAFNTQQNRHGSLFQKGFKRIQQTTYEQLLDKIAYVHHNPLHHNMSPFYNAWTYSSYPAYLSNKPTSLKREEGLLLFDGLKSFIDFHENYHTQWVKSRGSQRFDDEMEL
jgi:REP element-mobilizing transposase RayT